MPYCLDRQPDGRYAVLNRRYKPVGFVTSEWVDYAAHPVLVRVKGLDPATAARLSIDGRGDLDRIYLYNDATCPTASAANMRLYLDRLAILAGLTVE